MVHDNPEADKQCACGAMLKPFDQEISEQLYIVPVFSPQADFSSFINSYFGKELMALIKTVGKRRRNIKQSVGVKHENEVFDNVRCPHIYEWLFD